MATASIERICEEVGALEAILMDELVVHRENDIPTSIETVVHPATANNTNEQYVCVTVEVKITLDYPDVSPVVVLKNPRGLTDEVLADIRSQVDDKLTKKLGQQILFELVELVRDVLTKWNQPSGNCVICLFDFDDDDKFTRTTCYHYFHDKCLGYHLMTGRAAHQEEKDKLPLWQQLTFEPFKQLCPICRCPVECDIDKLKDAAAPLHSMVEMKFELTDKMKEQQKKMASLLAKQIAKGGIITTGDSGPPLLTITSPSDLKKGAPGSASGSGVISTQGRAGGRPDAARAAPPAAAPALALADDGGLARPADKPVPYRGFNRRSKPGRRRAQR